MHYGRLLPADPKLCYNAAGVTEYHRISCEKFTPHLHIAQSNESVKCYFRDTLYNGSRLVWCHSERLCLSSRPGFASPQSAHTSLSTNFDTEFVRTSDLKSWIKITPTLLIYSVLPFIIITVVSVYWCLWFYNMIVNFGPLLARFMTTDLVATWI